MIAWASWMSGIAVRVWEEGCGDVDMGGVEVMRLCGGVEVSLVVALTV